MSQTTTYRRQVSHVLVDAMPIAEIGRGLWDGELGPMVTYAQLCTRDAAAAERLVLQAEEHSRVIAQKGVCETDDLPTVAVALNAVLDTAVRWSALPANRGWLSDGLLEWLEKGGGTTAGQLGTREALAVVSLRHLAAGDSELFWWSCVEGLPDEVVAQRLGCSRAQVCEDVLRVTAEFRRRSSLAHSFQTQNSVCHSYAGLLDATARRRAPVVPEDLQKHLNECYDCAEDFECLSADSTRLPTVIAEAVLRWNGSAYVSVRRRNLADANAITTPPAPSPPPRSRWRRSGTLPVRCLPLLWAVAAGASMLLVAGSLELVRDNSFPRYVPPPRTMEEPERESVGDLPSPEASDPGRPEPGSSEGAPDDRAEEGAQQSEPPTSESSPAERVTAGSPPVRNEPPPASPTCSAVFDVTHSWDGGVEAQLNLSPQWALKDWTVTFRVPGGSEITDVWNGTHTKEGDLVRVTAANYNRTSAAGDTLSIGIVLRGDFDNGSWLSDVRVDERACTL